MAERALQLRCGRSLELEVSDVDRPGTAPTRLSARLTPDGAEILDVSAVGSRVDVRATTPVELA